MAKKVKAATGEGVEYNDIHREIAQEAFKEHGHVQSVWVDENGDWHLIEKPNSVKVDRESK